jgi:uroporphyrinogen decarboxylase
MLTSRERVLYALNHEEPDRVPVFFGTSGVTTMLAPAYERLKAHLGIQLPPRLISSIFQYARLDEEVMQRFGSDGRPLLSGPAPSIHRRTIDPEAFVDEWGIEWRRAPGALYYEETRAPLREATLDDLARYAWPDLGHPSRFVGLTDEARRIHKETGCAVVALSGASLFEQIQLLRGMETFLTDMAANREFAEALIRKVADLMLAGLHGLMSAAGAEIDVVVMGDDLGTQNAPIMSPRMYRNLFKPRHAELIAAIKTHSAAKVFFHSDGNIYPLLGDLVDVGVDLLNPVQVSAGAMGDTARLKREFGDRLSFCGAVDTGWVLPHGTPGDVRREVRQRIADLAPGGGYVLASVHCIQPDVPLENVIAMFEEAAIAGRYPLHG